jgi:hypothetical protein
VDLPEVLTQRIPVGQGVHRQLGVAQDDGEEVVEVVRHAPGQGADGLHLLRLHELLLAAAERRLGALLRGEVEHEADAVGILEHRHSHEDWHTSAVRTEELLLPRPSDTLHLELRRRGGVDLVPFRRGYVVPAMPTRQKVVAREAQHVEIGVVRVVDMPVHVGEPNPDDPRVVQSREARLGAAESVALFELASGGGAQPREASLEDEIARTRPHGFDGGLLPHRAGHDDRRQAGLARAEVREDRWRVQVRERPVGDHEIPGSTRQGSGKIWEAVHALGLDVETRLGQLTGDQLRVRDRVLDEEDPRGRAHYGPPFVARPPFIEHSRG